MPRNRNIDRLVDYCLDNRDDDLARAIVAEVSDVGEQFSYCDRCNDLIHCDDEGSQFIHGDQWCDNCVENHAWYWESDGEYHNEPEPEDEEDESGIPAYHESTLALTSKALLRDDVLGVELETWQDDPSDAAEFFSGLREDVNDKFKFERDGSLDDHHGVELAAYPMTLEAIRKEGSIWNRALEWCRSNGARAWDAGKNYGMHVSLNGAQLSKLHRARIVRFINDNKELCEEIAGRNENNWAKYMAPGKMSQCHKGTDKYLAAANRGDRIEIRIFRASLNEERFFRNCEFCDAVRVYCKDCGLNERAMAGFAFKEWIGKPENRKSYPKLAKFYGFAKQVAQPSESET